MKLAKAIEIAEDILRTAEPGDPPDEYDALTLLIEAGQRLMRIRTGPHSYCSASLPGETPEAKTEEVEL